MSDIGTRIGDWNSSTIRVISKPKKPRKDTSDSATSLARQVFDPQDWHPKLVDRALPVMAVQMAEAAVAFLMSMGIDVRGQKRRDGTWVGPESTPNYARLRRRIDEGKARCARCGSKRQLRVHHRDDNSRHDGRSNLEVICESCHQSEHRGKNTKHLPGGHNQLTHGRGGGLGKTLEVVKKGTGFTEDQIRDALTGDVSSKNPGRAKVRAKIIGAIYASGTQVKDAVGQVLDNEPPAVRKEKLNKLVDGKLKNVAVKELADLPGFDLDILSRVEARGVPVQGEATCSMVARKVTGGVGTRSGSWRHEVGHAIRSSWGGDSPSSSRVMTRAASKRYDEVQSKIKEKPIGKKKKMSHEWYEQEYGVAGRRSVDNWEENSAEHYRLYHRELYRDRKEGGGGKYIAQYRERHPEWAKMWDAHYTAALLGQSLGK